MTNISQYLTTTPEKYKIKLDRRIENTKPGQPAWANIDNSLQCYECLFWGGDDNSKISGFKVQMTLRRCTKSKSNINLSGDTKSCDHYKSNGW